MGYLNKRVKEVGSDLWEYIEESLSKQNKDYGQMSWGKNIMWCLKNSHMMSTIVEVQWIRERKDKIKKHQGVIWPFKDIFCFFKSSDKLYRVLGNNLYDLT